ncbi:MAG: hypothetical protein J3K34DRAFT_423210 [Monoraphidium minutum]|nr:MAG: hypothetical protein J3K34DRAFT_423210 [Monoraphidium minutum]
MWVLGVWKCRKSAAHWPAGRDGDSAAYSRGASQGRAAARGGPLASRQDLRGRARVGGGGAGPCAARCGAHSAEGRGPWALQPAGGAGQRLQGKGRRPARGRVRGWGVGGARGRGRASWRAARGSAARRAAPRPGSRASRWGVGGLGGATLGGRGAASTEAARAQVRQCIIQY